MEKLQSIMLQYIEKGFTISTVQVGNNLHVIVKDNEGKISEEFDIIKISKKN